MVGSKCNLKTHIQNMGYPLLLQIGGPKTTFSGRLRNSPATLKVYIFGKEHDIHQQASALQTKKGSSTSPQNDKNFGPQTALNWK